MNIPLVIHCSNFSKLSECTDKFCPKAWLSRSSPSDYAGIIYMHVKRGLGIDKWFGCRLPGILASLLRWLSSLQPHDVSICSMAAHCTESCPPSRLLRQEISSSWPPDLPSDSWQRHPFLWYLFQPVTLRQEFEQQQQQDKEEVLAIGSRRRAESAQQSRGSSYAGGWKTDSVDCIFSALADMQPGDSISKSSVVWLLLRS